MKIEGKYVYHCEDCSEFFTTEDEGANNHKNHSVAKVEL